MCLVVMQEAWYKTTYFSALCLNRADLKELDKSKEFTIGCLHLSRTVKSMCMEMRQEAT